MSQDNKQLVLRAVNALNARDLDTIDELYHPDYVNHEARAGTPHGPAAARCTTAFLHSTFEDFRLEPFDVIAENDLVVVRAQAGGRHVGAIDGFQPSGRRFSVQHIHVFRVTDAKISEHWACRDDLGAARQMGLVPAPVEGAA
jgi:predicted ester cyclase